jgi:hypothetical protein
MSPVQSDGTGLRFCPGDGGSMEPPAGEAGVEAVSLIGGGRGQRRRALNALRSQRAFPSRAMELESRLPMGQAGGEPSGRESGQAVESQVKSLDKAGLARSALEGGAVIGDHLPADAISDVAWSLPVPLRNTLPRQRR